MVTPSNCIPVMTLLIALASQDSVARSSHKSISQSSIKEDVRSAIVPINPQDLQSKSGEGAFGSQKSQTDFTGLQGIGNTQGDMTFADNKKMSRYNGFSPDIDLEKDLDTIKSGNVQSTAMSQINPFELASPWGSNNDQNQRKYQRLYADDPLPEYNYKEKNYDISPETTHQEDMPSESYASINELKKKYKNNGEMVGNLLGSHDFSHNENQLGTSGGDKNGHANLISEIGKEVLLKLLDHNNNTDSSYDESERHVLFEKLLGIKPEVQGFTSRELSAGKVALPVTSFNEPNVTKAQSLGADTATAGKVSGKMTSEINPQRGKGTLAETNQSSQHQAPEQANGDSRHSAPKNEGVTQSQITLPNLEIEENTNAEIETESGSQGPTLNDGRSGNGLVTLKISGSGKPVSFKADTRKDGSLLLKIPGNVRLMDSQIGKEGTDQAESRSSQINGKSGSKQTSSALNTDSAVSSNVSKQVDLYSANREVMKHPDIPNDNSKSGVNFSSGASNQEGAGPKVASQEHSQTNNLKDKTPESGSRDTTKLLRKQLTGPSDWQILGKTNENTHKFPNIYRKNEEKVDRNSLLRDDEDNDNEFREENPGRVNNPDYLRSIGYRESNENSFASRKKDTSNYPASVLAVNSPSLPIGQPSLGYLSARLSEHGRLPNRVNPSFAGWNALQAYSSNERETSFTRGANGIIQPKSDDFAKMDILRLVDLARRKMEKIRQRNLDSRYGQYGSSDMPLKAVLEPSKYLEDDGMVRGIDDSSMTDGKKRYEIGDSQMDAVSDVRTHSWSTWSPCSITCGHGIQARARPCEGSGCKGYRTESKACVKELCPEELGQAGLRLHNKFRAWHKSPPLEWSKDLAKKAQTIAHNLASKEKILKSDLEEIKGENIAELKQNYDIAAEKATAGWYSEITNFKFKAPRLKDKTKHFTQLIWKDSRRLGMGITKSRDGKHTIVVALYDPPGNMESQVKENVRVPEESNKRDTILSKTF